ncbi:MAG TPA: hypothetical protein VK619_05565 [Pyrinomonadaceae bacterium]|nr:hypothetical protein [Pyrinomonadaceae bacterium]
MGHCSQQPAHRSEQSGGKTFAITFGIAQSFSQIVYRPNWETYANFLEFAEAVRRDLRDLRPRDMIDIQSFMWVQGSDEYEE